MHLDLHNATARRPIFGFAGFTRHLKLRAVSRGDPAARIATHLEVPCATKHRWFNVKSCMNDHDEASVLDQQCGSRKVLEMITLPQRYKDLRTGIQGISEEL